jgi:plasmid maintenance system antidote protein VapI
MLDPVPPGEILMEAFMRPPATWRLLSAPRPTWP